MYEERIRGFFSPPYDGSQLSVHYRVHVRTISQRPRGSQPAAPSRYGIQWLSHSNSKRLRAVHIKVKQQHTSATCAFYHHSTRGWTESRFSLENNEREEQQVVLKEQRPEMDERSHTLKGEQWGFKDVSRDGEYFPGAIVQDRTTHSHLLAENCRELGVKHLQNCLFHYTKEITFEFRGVPPTVAQMKKIQNFKIHLLHRANHGPKPCVP